MDNAQYHSNAMSNGNSPYSPLPGISPHQLQHNSNLPPHTLPPLQPQQHAAMQQQQQQQQSWSAPHTPRTPGTPNTPGSASLGYSQVGAQSRPAQMMYGNSYQQQPPQHQYRTSASMMPQSSTALSHNQPIAPAPATSRGPPLRPMPASNVPQHLSMHGGYPQTNMLQQVLAEEPPTHVVGSQGRRGILPSAPGRPQVTATGPGSTKNAMIPAKDADGKFPCPHCTKTYLHAKHLKRHLLRHTGDRPYMCVLCRDTFSRSDILKRHFQKCSIRRGNPTGASHLSHAQAHLKKSHPGPKAHQTMGPESDLMGMNGMNGMPNDGSMHPFGVVPDGNIADAGSNLTDDQASKASNDLQRLGNPDNRDRRINGPAAGGSSRSSFDQGYGGGMPSTMSSAMNPAMAFSMPNGQNGHSYSQSYDFASQGNTANLHAQSMEGMSTVSNGRHPMPVYAGANASQHPILDWPHMQSNGQNNFMTPYNNSNLANQQMQIKQEPYNSNLANTQIQIKQESSNHGLFTGVVYPGTSDIPSSDFSNWNIPAPNDPLQQISSQLLNFCLNAHSQLNARSQEIRKFLSADNIKHFLEQFSNFQGHFPIIHMPTFRITDSYEGLLLGMICIGAVYSDRMSPTQVREMMEVMKMVIESNSQVYSIISRGSSGDYPNESIGSSKSEIEQIAAIFMMQVLFTWHGTPLQREKARRDFPLVVSLARRAGLTQPMTTSPFSVLHQAHVNVDAFVAANFDWNAWVEQEKRSRLLYMIFLLDSALVIFFNIAPSFDALEIRLPLPADDAAWEARSSAECADALGLNGAAVSAQKNPEGNRRRKQPEMHTVLKTLMHHTYDMQPGTTNLFSKFVLVHALHVQLWTAQKQVSQESGQIAASLNSGTNTPLSQNDWVIRSGDQNGSGAPSANNSGRATPVDGQSLLSHQLLKSVTTAFEKWKKAWDEDISVQYPPGSSYPRRFGFCRDGAHFYWLQKCMLSQKLDWQMPSDQRFTHVIQLLKFSKRWASTDTSKRGEEPGSVSDIDKDFGVSNLTLDMAQLFRPVNAKIDSPVQGVHTNI
ncbi:hypothetical protein EAF04_007267 [Stromatinia cepivora]|nr:hypothetical protein EAF04_007267 [Stromatinia cepivora]